MSASKVGFSSKIKSYIESRINSKVTELPPVDFLNIPNSNVKSFVFELKRAQNTWNVKRRD